MVLNLLASPCAQIIDLRDKSELPCAEVMQGQLGYFFDEPAKPRLFEAMPLYPNQYPLGVDEYLLTAHQRRRPQLGVG